jgi:hypothetical protein
MDTNRQQWNQGQQRLRRALTAGGHPKAIELFLIQHAMVHAANVSKTRLWSFEEEVLRGMPDEQIRCVPPGGEHSIAWILFHIARCEDITMNLLVAGTPQVFIKEAWGKKMKATIIHSGNNLDGRAMAAFNARVDVDAVRAYRQSVGRRTRAIVKTLKLEQLKQKADPDRVQSIMEEGALLPEAVAILSYWRSRTVAGLLLMPPTRHNFLHLNEALRIRQKLQRSK